MSTLKDFLQSKDLTEKNTNITYNYVQHFIENYKTNKVFTFINNN